MPDPPVPHLERLLSAPSSFSSLHHPASLPCGSPLDTLVASRGCQVPCIFFSPHPPPSARCTTRPRCPAAAPSTRSSRPEAARCPASSSLRTLLLQLAALPGLAALRQPPRHAR